MNKILIFKVLLVAVIICVPLVGISAQNQKGIHEPGTGIENPELRQEGQGTGQGIQARDEASGQAQNQPGQAQNQRDVQGPIQNQQEAGMQSGNGGSGKGAERRSRVANAVQEMLKVGERNGGVGTQIRTIAQNQNSIQEGVEGALERLQQRSGFVRFLIGPKHKELNSIESQVEEHIQNIEELKELKIGLSTSQDQNIIEEQISVMEQARQELEEEAEESSRGFSLFGWLARRFAR